jgi:hypothetical protein
VTSPLNNNQVVEALSCPESNPLYMALTQVLEDLTAEEVSAAMNPTMSAEARAFQCGRAASLHDLRAIIDEIRAQGHEDSLNGTGYIP